MKQKPNTNITDLKDIRLKSLKRFCGLMFFVTLYFSFCISGLYKMELDIKHFKESIKYCLMHPAECYNEKTFAVVALGVLIWFVASFSAYSKKNMNLMHGLEYGSAKWGDKQKFNEKYAHIIETNDVVATYDRKRKK